MISQDEHIVFSGSTHFLLCLLCLLVWRASLKFLQYKCTLGHGIPSVWCRCGLGSHNRPIVFCGWPISLVGSQIAQILHDFGTQTRDFDVTILGRSLPTLQQIVGRALPNVHQGWVLIWRCPLWGTGTDGRVQLVELGSPMGQLYGPSTHVRYPGVFVSVKGWVPCATNIKLARN